MNIEWWISIQDRWDYLISSRGRFKSLRCGRILKEMYTKKKYVKYEAYDLVRKKKVNYTAHRLVAIAFIENEENKEQVNHIDGNKLNNDVSNLEWCTNQENHDHKMLNGLNVNFPSRKGIRHTSKNVTTSVDQYSLDGVYIKSWDSIAFASEGTPANSTGISLCCSGSRNKCGGFKWKYKKQRRS